MPIRPIQFVPAVLHFKGIADPGETEFKPLADALADALAAPDGRAIFRGEKLFALEPDPNLSICRIRVGDADQLPLHVQMPLWAFSPRTLGAGIHFDTAAMGKTLAITVRNASDKPVPFACEIHGEAVL